MVCIGCASQDPVLLKAWDNATMATSVEMPLPCGICHTTNVEGHIFDCDVPVDWLIEHGLHPPTKELIKDIDS